MVFYNSGSRRKGMSPVCLVICLGLLMAGDVIAQQPVASKRYSSGGPLRPLQANMDIRHYTITVTPDILQQTIRATTTIDLELKQPSDSLLFDLISIYQIDGISLNGKKTGFDHPGDSVLILPSSPLMAGRHRVSISYNGTPPIAKNPPWQGGFTWTKDQLQNPWIVINCQMEGGKIYFPCKDHPSDEPDEGIDMLITIPDSLSVAAPGLLQTVKKNKKERTAVWHWKTNYPISNYCMVFNIGKYSTAKGSYTTIAGHTVPIEFYVLAENKDKADAVIEMRKRDTRILEKYFGEYPWVKEKIGIAETPNYGMEHQTMITYGGENYRWAHYPEFDYSPNLFHEFTHEWFANKVTNRDWAHFWIQEGITTYGEALFFREMRGEAGYDSVMLKQRRNIQNRQKIVPGEEKSTAEVYGGDIYVKGSFLMHTLRYLMGDSTFFPALKALSMNILPPYDSFLVSSDVVRHFSSFAGKDLGPVFDFYLYSTSTMDFNVLQLTADSYAVYAENLPCELPVEIRTDAGVQKLVMKNIDKRQRNQMTIIRSHGLPVIDPGNWYLKRVIYQ